MPAGHPVRQDGITRPRVFLEGSGTFVADAAGALPLPDTSEPADVLQTDYLPYRSRRWFAVVDGRGRVARGGLNGALLRAGLVDELHIITVPALIGGLGTPSIIDGSPLEPGSLPVQLRVVDVQVGTHGSIWAHYELAEGSATLSADQRQRRERRRPPGRRPFRPPGLRVDEREEGELAGSGQPLKPAREPRPRLGRA
jgi:hypothetical protein